jgi:hypothetical protein
VERPAEIEPSSSMPERATLPGKLSTRFVCAKCEPRLSPARPAHAIDPPMGNVSEWLRRSCVGPSTSDRLGKLTVASLCVYPVFASTLDNIPPDG